MISYFLSRPIAVLTIFFCVVIAGFLAYAKLPVSLMPEISTSRLVIVVNYQGYGSEYIEQNILSDLRNQLSGVYGLELIESISANNVGHLNLTFEYNTNMKLAFIEANEKLDQASHFLPNDLPRPHVYRISDTDIPVLRLQVQSSELNSTELSNLTRYVLRRRIEGVSGVARVAVNGLTERVISIEPKEDIMRTLNLTKSDLSSVLKEANFEQFQIQVKEGIYEYNVRVENPLTSIETIRSLIFRTPSGKSVSLDQVAKVNYGTKESVGTHLFQGSKGIVINIHKQAAVKMQQLETELLRNIDQLQKEYPSVSFAITQNQSSFLSRSISQLSNSLVLGGILAFAILFVFSANYKLSVLMGLIIPATILVTFGILYLAGLSVNIITLSGLILGIGMLIDNAIILIDNIHLHHQLGLSLREACIKGANEIFTPLLSSAFTTLSVFLPLVFLGGMGGLFFQFQAMSLAAMLLSSLLVAFCLLPVIYQVLHPKSDRNSSQLYDWLLKGYRKSKKQIIIINVTLVALIFLAVVAVDQISITNLPEVNTSDAAVTITWADPVTLSENMKRTIELISAGDDGLEFSEFDVGIHSLDPSIPSFTNSVIGYLQFKDVSAKERNINYLDSLINQNFPNAKWEFSRPKNPFDQLFDQNVSFIKLKFRAIDDQTLDLSVLDLPEPDFIRREYGFITQKGLYLDIKQDRLNQIEVSADDLIQQINFYYKNQVVTEIQRTNQMESVRLTAKDKNDIGLFNSMIYAKDSLNSAYPIGQFFDWKEHQVNQFVTADLAGIYQSITYSREVPNPQEVIESVQDKARNNQFIVDLEGEFLDADQNLADLLLSLVLAVALLYFILAAQFESLKQPVIILITLPFALAGSILALYVMSYTFNISSLIGMIVTLGIIVNDSILKIDTINRMRKGGLDLDTAISAAGELRIKSILMTSITTILALIPLLFSSGLGADLQAPLAVTVIGGLFVGTICSVYMIPVLYSLVTKY